MDKVFIRFALPQDVPRLIKDQVFTGTPPPGETWERRLQGWLAEQSAGRRVLLVAEDRNGLLGFVQLIFKFPDGYYDKEAANGTDVAMMEALRLRPGAPPAIATQLVQDLENLARKKSVKTVTLCIPMTAPKAIAQAKQMGFTEFRVMAEANNRMLAFLRKPVE